MRLSLPVLGVALFALSGLLSSPGVRAEEEPESADEIEIVLTEALPLEDFLKAAGMVSQVSYVWDPGAAVFKAAELISAQNLRASRLEFSALVRALLSFHGLGLVPVGPEGNQVYRVVDLEEVGRRPGARLKPTPVELTPTSLAWLETQDGLYVSATMPVVFLKDLDTAARALADMGTGQGIGRVTALPEIRALLLADFAPVVARLHAAILDLDERARLREESKSVETVFDEAFSSGTEFVALEHARALEVEAILVDHYGANAAEPGVTGGLKIHGDARSNTLLVTGAKQRVARVLEAIQHLDVPTETSPTWTHVLRLKHVQAVETAAALQTLLGDAVRIVPHAGQNALLVTATPQDFDRLKMVLAELDKM